MIIYAVNIHTGGGKVLLDELFENQPFGKISAAFLDTRYVVPTKTEFPIFTSRGKLWDRFKAELRLHRFLKENPTQEPILFFGNLPPFFKPRTISYLYLQNCFLTRQVPLPRDSFKEMMRNWIESLILRFFSKNVNEIWVQTSWMKRITERFLPQAQVQTKPFLPSLKKWSTQAATKRNCDFLFVGSLSLNKRFSFFVQALKKIDTEVSRKIQVTIVLDQPSREIENLHFQNIEIQLRFRLNREELATVYQQSQTYVATALHESFGLPLYESHFFGCQVIAPKAGYTEALPFSVQLFETHSVQDLADQMLKSLSH